MKINCLGSFECSASFVLLPAAAVTVLAAPSSLTVISPSGAARESAGSLWLSVKLILALWGLCLPVDCVGGEGVLRGETGEVVVGSRMEM
ncbi:hypothetical protein E2C01_006277 [Portunus trituberculatus]|uniref:Uncharacterized protein n=1 Tax=Portunus trituberculatus TaxID=210409 RepID=A0A5B7CVW3_PORTR|nr:hypothetical protein [Portunus trituberculatus]